MAATPAKLHLVLLAVVLTCCVAGTDTPPAPTAAPAAGTPAASTATPAVQTPAGPAASPTAESPAATATLTAGTYRNPVFDRDFPDPDTIREGDMYYAYATNSGDLHVQVARSTDLVEWEALAGDALPELPGWAVQDFGWTWAPDVSKFESQYVMYYTTRLAIGSGGVQCIGVATAAQAEGPFQPEGDEPFVCQTNRGGSIDAATFVDNDGSRYLLWKNDGNSMGGQSWIHIQRLAAGGLALEGEPVQLLTADRVWEGILVEGPTLWKQEGRYYLFYSANDFASPRYAAGYAVADEPLGPYDKAREPLLATDLRAQIVGPGGQDVVLGPDGDTWLLFHDWSAGGYRHLNLVPLDWDQGLPAVQFSSDPQPAPED